MNKLLIIDDEAVVRNGLRITLANEGCEIIMAENGKEGLKLVHQHNPQIIILDLKMPVMGGIEFLEQLHPYINNPYSVIVLTGYGTDEDIERCYQLGVQNFLRKPVNLYELKGVVQRTFQLIQEMAAKKEACSLLQKTFEGIAEGVIVLDQHLHVQMISQKACKMLEILKEEALGKPAVLVLGSTIAGPSSDLSQYINHPQEVFDLHTQLPASSGVMIPINLSIIPLEVASQNTGWMLLFRNLRAEERLLWEKRQGISFGRMVSCNTQMKELFQVIENIAQSNSTVLIEGESGTGKELVAQEVYERSRQAQGPFHAVNCAAISTHLIESEFFGYERGAFTGAYQSKKGRFEMADGGVLFLDEIGDLPLELQGKLLRALQEQRFERVGGTKSIHVNVRIIAATNKDLQQMVQQGEFRSDLYYRLNVVSLRLPPLQERLEDIPLLVSLFIEQLNRREKRQVKNMAPDALQLLFNHSWPGNVRELYHTVEHAFAVSNEMVLQRKHLPESIRGLTHLMEDDSMILKNEKELILDALEQTDFNKPKTAALLGIHRATLYRKLKKYNI